MFLTRLISNLARAVHDTVHPPKEEPAPPRRAWSPKPDPEPSPEVGVPLKEFIEGGFIDLEVFDRLADGAERTDLGLRGPEEDQEARDARDDAWDRVLMVGGVRQDVRGPLTHVIEVDDKLVDDDNVVVCWVTEGPSPISLGAHAFVSVEWLPSISGPKWPLRLERARWVRSTRGGDPVPYQASDILMAQVDSDESNGLLRLEFAAILRRSIAPETRLSAIIDRKTNANE